MDNLRSHWRIPDSRFQIPNPMRKIWNLESGIWNLELNEAKSRLDNMLGFANEGLMIPEQVWDKKESPDADKQFVPNLKFGEGTGSATPLAWSMAQFIRLAVNLKAGRNLDTPQIVYDRYVNVRQSTGCFRISAKACNRAESAPFFAVPELFSNDDPSFLSSLTSFRSSRESSAF